MSKEMRRASGDHKKWKKNSKVKRNIKVVHISNPLKVTLSATEYKKRVQQLTGQNSYVADIMFREAKEGRIVNDQQDDNHDHVTVPSAVAPYPSTDNHHQPDMSTTTSTSSRSFESSIEDLILFDDFFHHHI